jgi:RNA polymerase sigma-70 factor (ECF subfamily)
MNTIWQTRNTLIQEALDRSDEDVWNEFSAYYRPFILYLLKRINVADADLDDVAQDVLITLWKKLDLYVKEKGTFRTWLGTVIRHTAYNHFAKKKQEYLKHEAIHEKTLEDQLPSYSEPEFQQIIDEEWKTHLSNLALQRITTSFGENAIQCFLDGMHEISAAETAQRLNLSIETVYSSRKRVKARLLRELQHLRQQLEF